MSGPVSAVVPTLDDRELLGRCLPALLDEVERRGAGDEVIVVDDTGGGEVARWLSAELPDVRSVALPANVGFARALTAGVEAASHERVLALNPDVVPRPGFLDPLVECLEGADVFAVSPRVLLGGDERRVESLTRLVWRDGGMEIEQPALHGAGEALEDGSAPLEVAFAVGGAFLFRRSAFEELGGLDPLYEPFYLEDLDLCLVAWRRGLRVLLEPRSVVEHHHRGTIGRVADEALVRAAIEKNRLLLQWKHLEGGERMVEHLATLYRRALDAHLADERDPLLWLALALEQLDEVFEARSRVQGAGPVEPLLDRPPDR